MWMDFLVVLCPIYSGFEQNYVLANGMLVLHPSLLCNFPKLAYIKVFYLIFCVEL
jgi:hypothetical protein